MSASPTTKTSTNPIRVASEREIEQACSKLLQYDGWRMLKTDPVSRREWGKGFGELGMADCQYIRYRGIVATSPQRSQAAVELMWIEWKGPDGKATQLQRHWHIAERARGALTLIGGEDFPASVEGFLAWYRSSGLMRRSI